MLCFLLSFWLFCQIPLGNNFLGLFKTKFDISSEYQVARLCFLQAHVAGRSMLLFSLNYFLIEPSIISSVILSLINMRWRGQQLPLHPIYSCKIHGMVLVSI